MNLEEIEAIKVKTESGFEITVTANRSLNSHPILRGMDTAPHGKSICLAAEMNISLI